MKSAGPRRVVVQKQDLSVALALLDSVRGGCSSVVERQLSQLQVTRSIRVARS